MKQEPEDEKIKTLLDFKKTDESFEDFLSELDSEYSGNHGIIWWERWTDDQLNDFADIFWDTAEQICHILMNNNQI